MAIDERLHLLKLHPCSRGLSEDALQEIAESAELIQCSPGAYVHRTGEPVTAIYLVIHGRIRVSVVDLQGRKIMDRYQGAGGQFGGVAAALAEPSPVECVAQDPSTLLKIDYRKCLELTKKHDVFRVNFARTMAESVKNSIFNDRLPNRPRIVAFFHQADGTRIVSQKLFRRLVEYGEQLGVLTDRADDLPLEGWCQCRVFGGERDWSVEEVRTQSAQWLESGRVFADCSTAIDLVRAASTLEKCELAFWCVTPRNWQASVPRLREIESRAPGWRDKVRILWLLEAGETAPVANELRDLARRDVKISFGAPTANQGKVVFDGFERLVHLVRGIQIGVALGGGAARGMAHLGVLKALEQCGVTVDMIAGTSAGAMTGTLCSAGLDPDYLVGRFVHDLTPSWFFRSLPRGDQWFLLYKYRMGRFEPMLRKYLGELCLEQLPIPMHTVTVDLIGGESVVRSAGDAVHGVLESINLPVLSKPINRPGQALVDGGLINNIPADVLVSKGCNFVIAVSVTAKMDREFARNRPDTPFSQMRSASAIQTILRSFLVQSTSVNAIGVQPADFVIEPDVSGFELTEFSRTDELAAIGEQATRNAIPQIMQLLNRLDGELFQTSSDVARSSLQ
jgi:NTE family protein